ncbi:hypothetical protein YWIDRAFT_07569 [Streptomyces sp. SceaMP-e96]|uniref:hypothetical protein n=1 Tax=Streptomyces TaxID=1883 RepID=UPI000823A56A|nr:MULTISPECIES: hypothetical protein [unclassified Streptomyces]MYT17925.1 hypothetical protein [Streptomyces sp. SID4951]SCK47885.1 hypothetical protein YWIDRAFT_07569 [Streptomyces sp. SceaMP-e96]
MNTFLNVNATAVADLTGEAFRSASIRLADRHTWTDLVASASRDQALLEALILSGLASYRSPEHPLGVVEAFHAKADLLHLRLESAGAVEGLLDLLPYREKRGTRRGIPGMQACVIGKQLELTASFGDKTGIRWNVVDPKVRIHLQGDEPLATLLQARHERVIQERCTPQWVPGEAVAPLRRRPPLSRDVISQHRASAQLASALLRRPRMWTALVGHDGLTVSSAVAEHGLDWTLVRTVAGGAELHDERLVELLQDAITGPDLQLLDHVCEPKTCTLRFVGSGGRVEGWRGIFTVRTEHGSSATGRPGRALAALGEARAPSRPAHRTRAESRLESRRCFVLTSGPSSPEAVHGVTAAAAVRLVSAWAAEGHVAAVLTVNDGDFDLSWYHSGNGTWPKAEVPRPESHVVRWNRLRLTPGNGEAWRARVNPRPRPFAVVDDEAIDAALAAARERCSRILVLDGRPTAWAGGLTNKGVDGVIFAFGANEYPRSTTTPAWRRAVDGNRAVDLGPYDSAALWREQHLGQHDLSQLPLAGLVLLHNSGEQTHSDVFTEQVEEHLSRYGTPVLGWLPPETGGDRLLLHSDGTKTALDGMSQEDRAGEIAAASAIGGKLW